MEQLTVEQHQRLYEIQQLAKQIEACRTLQHEYSCQRKLLVLTLMESGLTQQRIADELGVAKSTISHLVRLAREERLFE